jgi:hypothetical protein
MKLHKWSDIKRSKSDPERAARVKRRAQEEPRALTLRQLREEAGKTQVEVAELAEVTRWPSPGSNGVKTTRSMRYGVTLRRSAESSSSWLVIGNKRVKLLGV